MSRASLKSTILAGVAGAVTVLAIATGCSRDNVAQAAPPADQAPAQVQDDAQPFAIETATVGECKAGSECTATIKITAKGDYHVNDTYPFRFTAGANPGVEFHGSGGNVFSGGDFARQGKTVGVMTLKFKPKDKGNLAITGAYKVCICTDKICQPTTTNVTVNVVVK